MNANPATVRPDWTVPLAAACVACSWFLMSSLNTDLGFMRLQFRFYNVLTLMRAPGRIVTGADGDGSTLDALWFGTLCALVNLVALAPMVSRRRIAWLGCVAPFALMALSGAILYHGLSRDLIADSGALGDTGSQFLHFANSLVTKIGTAMTRRIHVGAGGYLALAATAFLAVKGLLGYQKAARVPQQIQ